MVTAYSALSESEEVGGWGERVLRSSKLAASTLVSSPLTSGSLLVPTGFRRTGATPSSPLQRPSLSTPTGSKNSQTNRELRNTYSTSQES